MWEILIFSSNCWQENSFLFKTSISQNTFMLCLPGTHSSQDPTFKVFIVTKQQSFYLQYKNRRVIKKWNRHLKDCQHLFLLQNRLKQSTRIDRNHIFHFRANVPFLCWPLKQFISEFQQLYSYNSTYKCWLYGAGRQIVLLASFRLEYTE